MPELLATAFFPSRSSRPLEKETSLILDLEEATGAPRLTTSDVFGPKSRNGLFVGNNPVNLSDPTGEDPVALPGGGFSYVARQGFDHTTGGFILNRNPRYSQQCATAGQFFAGTVQNGVVYDVPPVRTWTQGAPVNRSTAPGTLVAIGWQGGRYPGLSPDEYGFNYGAGATVNHTAIFGGVDSKGHYLFYDQWTGKQLGYSSSDSSEGWYVVNGSSDHDSTRSESAFGRVVDWDKETNKPIFQGIPVANPFDSTNVNIFQFPSGAMTLAGAPGVGRPDKFVQP